MKRSAGVFMELDKVTPAAFWCARAAMLMGDTSAPADEPPPPLPPLPWDVASLFLIKNTLKTGVLRERQDSRFQNFRQKGPNRHYKPWLLQTPIYGTSYSVAPAAF